MTVAKLTHEALSKFGAKINMKKFASENPIQNTSAWSNHAEELHVPSPLHFKNDSFCGGKAFTLLTSIYEGYGKMAPLRRNPQSIRAKEVILDSKTISVQILVSRDPNKLEQDASGCKLDHDKMRYNPISMKFYHFDKQTALRKLLWHDDDLDTNIEVRKCVVFNENIGRFGAWDADKCTTVLSEQRSTGKMLKI